MGASMKRKQTAKKVTELLNQGAIARHRRERTGLAAKPPGNALPEMSEPPYDDAAERDFARKPTLLVAYQSEKRD